ncbi:hypothetical protein L1987_78965 [Smallanthus sonchifolius]|uniref:Uncharacterized protein n=1 Tax=Smallanthus sonchifolius TaxID=185202 RepID=A0ACB8ZE47_9ASTR|nr:hypothetical protein L1987_78965 [Smallanthus sonchifolius]
MLWWLWKMYYLIHNKYDLLLDPQQMLMASVAAALKAIGYEIEVNLLMLMPFKCMFPDKVVWSSWESSWAAKSWFPLALWTRKPTQILKEDYTNESQNEPAELPSSRNTLHATSY